MNATDTKTVVSYYEEDIARLKASIAKTQAECTHVFADGTTAVIVGRRRCGVCQKVDPDVHLCEHVRPDSMGTVICSLRAGHDGEHACVGHLETLQWS